VVIDEFLKTADLLPEAMLLVSSDGVVLAANRAELERRLKCMYASRTITAPMTEPMIPEGWKNPSWPSLWKIR